MAYYRRATALYLLSVLSQSFNIIIYHGISAPGNVIYVVDGLNDGEKWFIFHLMATVQLPITENFDTQMAVYTATQNADVSLALEFQKHFSNASHKHGISDHVKHKKMSIKKSGLTGSITHNTINMLTIKTSRCIVQQTSFMNFSFLVHKKNHMVYTG